MAATGKFGTHIASNRRLERQSATLGLGRPEPEEACHEEPSGCRAARRPRPTACSRGTAMTGPGAGT
jgi:hypothetical protein